MINDNSIIHSRSINRSDLIKSNMGYGNTIESPEIRYELELGTPLSSTSNGQSYRGNCFKIPLTKENRSIIIPECDINKKVEDFVGTCNTPRQLPKSKFCTTPARWLLTLQLIIIII